MKIKVEVAELRQTLVTNKAKHIEIYEEAKTAYHNKAVRWFEKQLEKANDGWNKFERSFGAPVPEEHVEDFDRAIDMCDWSMNETIELDEHQFDQLVRNQWSWQRSFTANTASYVSNFSLHPDA